MFNVGDSFVGLWIIIVDFLKVIYRYDYRIENNNVLFSNLKIIKCFRDVVEWYDFIEYVFLNKINVIVFWWNVNI